MNKFIQHRNRLPQAFFILPLTVVMIFTACMRESPTVTPAEELDAYLGNPPGSPDMRGTIAFPANGSTGIPLDSRVILVFTHDIDASSVSAVSISPDPGGIPGVNVSGHVITITPGAAFTPSTVYTVNASTALRSTAAQGSRPLLQNYSWTFTTSADNSATFNPQVLLRYPTGTGISENLSFIEVTFTKPVIGVTAASFTLTGAGTYTVTAPVAISGSNTWRLGITGPLNYNTIYTVSLTTAITDASGNAIPADTWNFQTEAAPAVLPAITIESHTVMNVTDTAATLTWTTNRALNAAQSRFGFALSPEAIVLGNTAMPDGSSVFTETLALIPGTLYYYTIECTGGGTDTVTGTFYSKYAVTPPGSQTASGNNTLRSSAQLWAADGSQPGTSVLAFSSGTDTRAAFFSAGGIALWGVNGAALDSNSRLSPRVQPDHLNGFFLTMQSATDTYYKRVYDNAGTAAFYYGDTAGGAGATIAASADLSIVPVYGGQGALNITTTTVTNPTVTSGAATFETGANTVYDFDIDISAAAFADNDIIVDPTGLDGTTVTKSAVFRHALVGAGTALTAGNTYYIGAAGTTVSFTAKDHRIRNTVDNSVVADYLSNSIGIDYHTFTGHGAAAFPGWTGAGDILFNGTDYGIVSVGPASAGGLTAAETGTTYLGAPIIYPNTRLVPDVASIVWNDTYDNALIIKTSGAPALARVIGATSPQLPAYFNDTLIVNGSFDPGEFTTSSLNLTAGIFDPATPVTFSIYTQYCTDHSTDLNQIDPFYRVRGSIGVAADGTLTLYNYTGVTGTIDAAPAFPLFDDGANFTGIPVNADDTVLNFTDLGALNRTRTSAAAIHPRYLSLLADVSFGAGELYHVLRMSTAASDQIIEYGTVDTASTTEIISTDSSFTAGMVGSVVYNITQNRYAAVTAFGNVSTMTISRNIGNAVTDRFIVFNTRNSIPADDRILDLGAVLVGGAGTFTDTDADFVNAGIVPGDFIRNATTGTEARIITVAATALTLTPAITMNFGDQYHILRGRYATLYRNGGDIFARIHRLADRSAYTGAQAVCNTADTFSSPIAVTASSGRFYALYYNDTTDDVYGKLLNGYGAITVGGPAGNAGIQINTGAMTDPLASFQAKSSAAGSRISVLMQTATAFQFRRLDTSFADPDATTYTRDFTGTQAVFDHDETTGNAYIAYVNATGDIMVTKLNSAADGVNMLPAFPYTIPLASASPAIATAIYNLSITPDGAGGAYVSWIDNRFFTTLGLCIFSLRIRSDGTPDPAYDTNPGAGTNYSGLMIAPASTWDYKDVGLGLLWYDDGGSPFGTLHFWYDWRNPAFQNIYYLSQGH